jgi:hypothetical protein
MNVSAALAARQAMAREVHERENLLRDARALVPRLALRALIGGGEQEVFAGFRGQSLSVYFGDDPVYHFNSRGELRRAYVDDQLVKADRGRLIFLTRRESRSESVLARQAHDEGAQERLQARMKAALSELAGAITRREIQLLGEAPPGDNALERIAEWLATHPSPGVAASPHVG